MNLYYDREGKPLELMEWAEKVEDPSYRRVALEDRGDVVVSTVWLGVNHALGDGPIHIFETMVLGGEYDREMWRYNTEAEAEAGHAEVVELVFGPVESD